jgi:hypothetical protein
MDNQTPAKQRPASETYELPENGVAPSGQIAKQPQDKDNRKRQADEPKQYTTHHF